MPENTLPKVGQVQGRPYLEAEDRINWFRSEHPDWPILTDIHTLNEQVAIFRASILNDAGQVMATATKVVTSKEFSDFPEKAETGAVSRALMFLGYGTEAALAAGAQQVGRGSQQRPTEQRRDIGRPSQESEAEWKLDSNQAPTPNQLLALATRAGVRLVPELSKQGKKLPDLTDFERVEIGRQLWARIGQAD